MSVDRWCIENLSQKTPFLRSTLLSNVDLNLIKSVFEKMLLIRKVEQKLAYEKQKGSIVGPVHLSVGQEAIAAALSHFISHGDVVFGNHRSHAHLLSLGTNLVSFFAEILAKQNGLSKGMGGSMHLTDVENGFIGSVPIVAATVPLAVGAGLARKMDGDNKVSVAYFGDGAIEEGIVHESLNLATNLEVPVVFIVENNLYASHMHISERQPFTSTVRFAEAHGIKNLCVDGNDVLCLLRAFDELVDYSRFNCKPVFLEAFTYRWLGHVDWREDIDVGVTRSTIEINEWKKKDPIKKLLDVVEQQFPDIKVDEAQINSDVDHLIEISWQEALNSSAPEKSMLIENVFYHG